MKNPGYFRINNWRQGDVIEDKSAIKALLKKSYGCKLSILPELLVIISQNCDILNQKLEDEPFIDFIIGCFNKKDKILLQGRNPRKLQIEHDKGVIGFVIYNILRVEKTVFEEVNPAKSSVIFDRKDIKQVVNWVSKRYIRAAFPDEFMRRLPKKHMEKAQKNSLMNDVSLIYIDVCNEELQANQDYHIIIIAGVKHDSDQKIISQVEDFFYDIFNIKGIKATSEARDEYDITYKTMSTYKRFDWDFRSLPENINVSIPVFGIDGV